MGILPLPPGEGWGEGASSAYNSVMHWLDETRDGVRVMRPAETPERLVVAFSGRGHAPEGESRPTPYLARRLADALGLDGTVIHWARQVHGVAARIVGESNGRGREPCAGECDALATDRPGVALVVQTADCVPILLAAPGAVGVAHAGWRGTAKNVAAAAVAALTGLGSRAEGPPRLARPVDWLLLLRGRRRRRRPVRRRFRPRRLRRSGFRLDLRAVNVAQLAAAGVPRDAIAVHPACTKCGGDGFASYRRDGARAGRMIALIARTSSAAHG